MASRIAARRGASAAAVVGLIAMAGACAPVSAQSGASPTASPTAVSPTASSPKAVASESQREPAVTCADFAALPSASPGEPAVKYADYAGFQFVDLLSEYQAAHRDVQIVELLPSGQTTYPPSMEQLLGECETVPDVLTFSSHDLQQVIASGRYGAPIMVGMEPAAMCFRPDLLAEAGLPSDREGFAALLKANGGGWDQYFDVGRQYTAATGRPWFYWHSLTWQAMVWQVPEGYSVPGRKVAVADDTELHALWNTLGAALADGLSAGDHTWGGSSYPAFNEDPVATMPCSQSLRSVMMSLTEDRGDATNWDVADVFPGGGWLAGATYIAVATESGQPAAATGLAQWLTALDQQMRYADSAVMMPADPAAHSHWMGRTSEWDFRSVPIDEIQVNRAKEIPTHVLGPGEATLEKTVVSPILDRIAAGELTVDEGWDEFVAAVG